MIFDENKAPESVPQEPKFEIWTAPPTARAKENEQKPEKWSNVKVRVRVERYPFNRLPDWCQFCVWRLLSDSAVLIVFVFLFQLPMKSRSGLSVAVPPLKPSFQPFVEEDDRPPAV